jgi:hypothetical protein
VQVERTDILAGFKRDGVDETLIAHEWQWELLERFCALYESSGLIDAATAPPLWTCCAKAASCWAAALDARPRGESQNGGIVLPWIGRRYCDGGVVALGMNLNDASGLARSFDIVAGDIDELGQGRSRVTYGYSSREYRGSDFPYRSTRTVALVLDWLDGRPATDREPPEELAPLIDRTIRLQTVKCSPQNDASSKPTNKMWENCPPLLLEDELRIAHPQAVVGFGGDVRWSVERMAGYQALRQRGRAWHGVLQIDAEPVPVFFVPHPSARGQSWPAGHADLAALLNESPGG